MPMSDNLRQSFSPSPAPAAIAMEFLENRKLLSAVAPSVTSAVLDNRGVATISFNQAINTRTLTPSTVKEFGPGTDRHFGTADDTAIPVTVSYSRGTLTVSGVVKADKRYRLVLTNGITGANGVALNGTGGRRGGNFDVSTAATTLTARFTTIAGNMDVALVFNSTLAPTISNFLYYADGKFWDQTPFNRNGEYDPSPGNVPILQGGRFHVGTDNKVTDIDTSGHAKIDYAQGINNDLGTLAMARGSSLTATEDSQFFFNTANDPILDSEQYSAFGSITNASGRAVLARLAAYPALNSASHTPVVSPPAIVARGNILDPLRDLILIHRVAMLSTITTTASAAPTAVRAAVRGTGSVIARASVALPIAPTAIFSARSIKDHFLQDDAAMFD